MSFMSTFPGMMMQKVRRVLPLFDYDFMRGLQRCQCYCMSRQLKKLAHKSY